MGFRANCKNCKSEMEPEIDRTDMVVYCADCGKPLPEDTFTPFAKKQMVSMGQIRRVNKKKAAYSVKCEHCEKELPPELGSNKKTLMCGSCKKELKNLSKPFANTVIQFLNSKKE